MVCPAATDGGVTDVIVGANGMISISKPPDVPPPGAGFVTVTVCLPKGNGGLSVPVRRVEDTNVVTSGCDPALMVAPGTKSFPKAVSTTST